MAQNAPFDLLARYKKGDEEAFKWLYHEYFKRLVAYCNKIIGNEGIAQEITNTSLLALFKGHNILDFNSETNFTPFLFTTARNNCFRYLEQQKRVIKGLNAYKDYATYYEGFHDNEEYEIQVFNDMLTGDLIEAINQLPARSRQVIELLYGKGYSHEKAAQEMQVSVGSIKNFRAYAILLLKNYFEGKGFGQLTLLILIITYLILL